MGAHEKIILISEDPRCSFDIYSARARVLLPIWNQACKSRLNGNLRLGEEICFKIKDDYFISCLPRFEQCSAPNPGGRSEASSKLIRDPQRSTGE